jgi:DNA polymerase III psi subunit
MSARSTIVKSHGLCFLHDRNSLDTYVRLLCVGQESLDMDVEPASPLLKRALSSLQLRLSTGVLGLAREASSDLTAVVALNSKLMDPEAASNSKELLKDSPKLPTTQTTQTTPEIARLVSKSKAKSPGFDFEQYYGVSCKSAGEVLNEIL